ncbi:hypothetical protein H2201_008054 [Coniosporium apollinis]|uniref:Protein kinase domain-containing protein n=1 Tax=Coniosporium apollinis TaxID=61459 RepID=A0ABQ9NHI7_9PEZI|nr:hypothetical protein H2201_008054 [Coniosporium apollinis]
MSSAAVQSTGSALSTNRQYQQPPHNRDQYFAQTSPNAAASPASSRKAARGPSGTASASNSNSPHTPQQQQYHSPAGSSTSNMTTPRAYALPPSTHNSPAIVPAAISPTALNYAGGPPIAPPRTSSHQRSQTATAPATDAQIYTRPLEDRLGPSRTTQFNADYDTGSDRERVRDDPASSAAAAAQTRRRAHQSPKDSPQQQGGSSSRSRPSPVHSRSATAVGSTPIGTELPREESTIIDRLVVGDPQEDIAREQARIAESQPMPASTDVTPTTGLGLVGSDGVNDGGRGAGKSRQEYSKSGTSRKETKFGDYILGQTLGEGEFGKVKMGWKKEGGVQVAIKLIRRETLGSNKSRLQKIYREIEILKGLQHPNIVRLHEMVQTERHIGIILEYASGGELFDYILNHRYLKDNAARRLFAQLVSGVGYLHKKGIVHRDLKLENLLLDRNRNIIITDFGFANTFNPDDELGEEIEYNLTSKDFVKRMNLDQTDAAGHRRGDLMQTSCGSPCYAAPELVVSDSLYTGRKVDVWSCGVILYAMLAGYLPFDDDPANPEGDNINLLYKYIVSTPLTFPEYVTPHARDLLKRILVPDPRKRADLFEVARHSWLSDYAHVVGFITSSTTTSNDIVNATVPSEDPFETPLLNRSASVREPGKPHTTASPVGGLTPKHGHVERAEVTPKGPRDVKRNTVQVEYVAPHLQTTREAPAAMAPATAPIPTQQGTPRTRATDIQQGLVEVPSTASYATSAPLQQTNVTASMPPPSRPGRDAQRAASDSTAFGSGPSMAARPSTAGTLGSNARLPSRGSSYGQPAVATVAATTAQGRFAQPKSKQYIISAPMPQHEPMTGGDAAMGRPSTQRTPSDYQALHQESQDRQSRGHKRSNTASGLGEKLFGRTPSIFGRTSSRDHTQQMQQQQQQKPPKSYPPVSMQNALPAETAPRRSTESGRRISGMFSRKNGDMANTASATEKPRRFSFLKGISSSSHNKEQQAPGASYPSDPRRSSTQQPPRSRPQSKSRPVMAFGRGESRSSLSTTNSTIPVLYDPQLDRRARDSPATHMREVRGAGEQGTGIAQAYYGSGGEGHGRQTSYGNGNGVATQPGRHPPSQQYPHQQQGQQELPPQDPYYYRTESGQSHPKHYQQQQQNQQQRPLYPPGFNSYDGQTQPLPPQQGQQQQSNDRRQGVLQKPNRKFNDAYEGSGSGTGAARKVMDFFRRRGRT